MKKPSYVFIAASIKHPRTLETYSLTPGEQISKDPRSLSDIVAVCNEGLIYDLLFKNPLKGEPYSEKRAADFLDFVHDGWRNDAHFVFFVRNPEGHIVGCCDLKSADQKEAEIGYWLSAKDSGIMGLVISEMVGQAFETGFQKMIAYTLASNQRSQKLLERCKFQSRGVVEHQGHNMQLFERIK